MARKQITQLIDDLDGETLEEGGQTVLFSLEGRAYEIDLSDSNAQKLRDALAPFISAGRSVGAATNGSRSSRTRTPRSASTLDLGAVRAWARDNGHQVNDRGRIPTAVLEAYEASH